jgi:hypothetical protein
MDWSTLFSDDDLESISTPEPEEVREEWDTPAVQLYKLALDLGVQAFRSEDTGGIYVRFPLKNHHEITTLGSERFKAWLTSKYFRNTKREPKSADINGALLLLQAEAWEEPPKKLYIRVAGVNGKIYIDLADSDHRVIEIDSLGWKVVSDCDVWFLRSSTQRSLPEPKAGGSLLDLRPFVNCSDDDFVILLGWIVASLNPEGPFPLLCISAEQGSGKSSVTTILKRLIDPDTTPKLQPFKDADSLFATAATRWLLAYDNMGSISEESSNHLCRLATGGGFSKRQLFTDNESFSCTAKRPLLLNGISLTLGRMDLLDRAYLLKLHPIETRMLEREYHRRFDEKHPSLLGALCSALSCALREADYIPDDLPRMADAAAFILRAEKGGGLPWEPGTFAGILWKKEQEKRDEALADDTCALKVLDLARNGGWCGTVKTLLGIILESAPAEEKKFLPNTPRGLGRKLEEIAPLLRDTGVRIEKRRTNTGWIVILGTTGGDEATESVNVVSELSERPKNNVHRANPCKHWAGEHSERCECTFRQRIFDDISSDTSDLNPGNPHTSDHDSILRNNVHYVHNVHQVSNTNVSESERPFSNVHHVLVNVHRTLATCSPQSASVVTNPFLIEDEDDEEDEA